MSRRKYDDEFKRDAVELLVSGGRELKPLAVDLGVCPATLRYWRDRYLRDRDSQGPPRGPAPADSAEGVHGRAKTQHGLRRAIRRRIMNIRIQSYCTAAVMNLKSLVKAILPGPIRLYILLVGQLHTNKTIGTLKPEGSRPSLLNLA